MKRLIIILNIIVISSLFANLQAQCVQCDGNNSVQGTYSSVMGMSNTTTSNSTAAFAGGYGSIADGDFAFAYGGYATAQGNNTLAIGRYVTAGVDNAMVIGRGSSTTHRLVNNEPNSLVIGFNSDIPTLFVKSNGTNTVGKVGIGTTTPTTLLDINGTLNVEEVVTFQDNLDVAGVLNVTDAATFGNNLDITGILNVTDVVTFNNTLTVSSKTTTHQLQITDGAAAGKVLSSDANGNASWIEPDTFIPESIWSENNGNAYIINSNVGIGTTNPSKELTVNGTILCKSVIVDDNVPSSDFVFEKDYELMSLTELENFVSTNHHLPEIPSAADFKKNGYDMNKMDDLLLRKVEELTLYIIASEKERAIMKAHIEDLENKVNK